ncbi:hypothetical protein [Singulisphaera sp. PoT]|uniref:hypothetical protein n=1 Tax=Singulisphaera sp. PoT TaxID=3411797 RepID=UPI003BF4E9A7
MANDRKRCRPGIEGLEGRLALSTVAAAPAQQAQPRSSTISAALAKGDTAASTVATLQSFTQAYLSRVGDPNYNPAFDLNHNGQVGQDDGKILVGALPPLTGRVPLDLRLTVAPQDKACGKTSTNLGGASAHKVTTVIGHTTPGALIFTGTGTLDLKLRGPAAVADAQGNFSVKVTLENGINQLDFQVVDHYGQQYLRAFPILWTGFSRYSASHPKRT